MADRPTSSQSTPKSPSRPTYKHVQFGQKSPSTPVTNGESRQGEDNKKSNGHPKLTNKKLNSVKGGDGPNESSPLLATRRNEDPVRLSPIKTTDDGTWDGDDDDSQETKSVWYLMLLTLSIGG